MKEAMVYYTDEKSIPVSYNRETMLKIFKREGRKPHGGFSIDDALDYAFLIGIQFGAEGLYKYLNDDQEEE